MPNIPYNRLIRILLLCTFTALGFLNSQEILAKEYDNNYFDKDHDENVSYLVQSTRIHHLHKELRHNIRIGYWSAAIADIEFVLAKLPNHPQALYLMSLVGQLSNETNRAKRWFQKALALYPQYAITHAQYGKFLSDTKNFKDGLKNLKKSLEIDPKLAIGHAWLAETYFLMNDSEKGEREFKKAKELGYQGSLHTQ